MSLVLFVNGLLVQSQRNSATTGAITMQRVSPLCNQSIRNNMRYERLGAPV